MNILKLFRIGLFKTKADAQKKKHRDYKLDKKTRKRKPQSKYTGVTVAEHTD